jgi:23S rRNA C2498 (ribose-2'-O)-methylase RlmM
MSGGAINDSIIVDFKRHFTKIENMICEIGTAGQRVSYIPIDWLLIGWIQRIIRKKYGFKKLPMNDVFCLLR